jgi:hypothetical protein
MSQLQKAILFTLSYHDIFDYPLTQKEIWRFLLLSSKFKVQNSKLRLKIQNCSKELVKKRKIFKKGSFYFLPKREGIVKIRKKREEYSREKIKIARKAVKILQLIPWVKMVGITGALAMDSSEQEDDIDFFIITAKKRLWLTRLLIVLILELLRKRRRPKDKMFKNKICPNLFLDEFSLSLVKAKRNLFTAHEICQMKPILNRGQTYEIFLKENLWVRQYLPNGIEIEKLEIKKLRAKEERKIFNIFNLLEKLTFCLQFKYMKPKKTIEDVSPHSAFFHPQNRAKMILEKYKKKIKKKK